MFLFFLRFPSKTSRGARWDVLVARIWPAGRISDTSVRDTHCDSLKSLFFPTYTLTQCGKIFITIHSWYSCLYCKSTTGHVISCVHYLLICIPLSILSHSCCARMFSIILVFVPSKERIGSSLYDVCDRIQYGLVDQVMVSVLVWAGCVSINRSILDLRLSNTCLKQGKAEITAQNLCGLWFGLSAPEGAKLNDLSFLKIFYDAFTEALNRCLFFYVVWPTCYDLNRTARRCM